jgi:hypothetical protein
MALVFAPTVMLTYEPPAAALAAQPSGPVLHTGSDMISGGLYFSLTWADAVNVQSERNGRELVLRFSRALGDAPVSDLEPQLAENIEAIRYGYDSLLLQLSPGVEPDVTVTDNGVAVILARQPGASGNGAAGIETDRSLLGFVKAKALLGAGSAAAARAELQRYIADVPIPPDIARASRAARIEGSSGNMYRSFAAFDRLLKNDPGNAVLLAHYATVLIDTGKLKLARNVLDYR